MVASPTIARESKAEGRVDFDAVVIGAGFTGLAAAYELARRGINATVLEAEPTIGGLAAGYDVGGQRLERFYHHWLGTDRHIIDLVKELGAIHPDVNGRTRP